MHALHVPHLRRPMVVCVLLTLAVARLGLQAMTLLEAETLALSTLKQAAPSPSALPRFHS